MKYCDFDSLEKRTDAILYIVRGMLTAMLPAEVLKVVTDILINTKTEPADVHAFLPVFECLYDEGLSVDEIKAWIADHPDEYLYDNIVGGGTSLCDKGTWCHILDPAEYADAWLKTFYPDVADINDLDLPLHVPVEKALNTFSMSELLNTPMAFEEIIDFDSDDSHKLAKRVVRENGYPDNANDKLVWIYTLLFSTGEIDADALAKMISNAEIDDESKEEHLNCIGRSQSN